MDAALAVMRRAIQNEIAGQRFYNDAAYHCIDPWAKELFASLAQEEENHTRLLLVEYEAVETHGRWIDPNKAMSDGRRYRHNAVHVSRRYGYRQKRAFPGRLVGRGGCRP